MLTGEERHAFDRSPWNEPLFCALQGLLEDRNITIEMSSSVYKNVLRSFPNFLTDTTQVFYPVTNVKYSVSLFIASWNNQ